MRKRAAKKKTVEGVGVKHISFAQKYFFKSKPPQMSGGTSANTLIETLQSKQLY